MKVCMQQKLENLKELTVTERRAHRYKLICELKTDVLVSNPY